MIFRPEEGGEEREREREREIRKLGNTEDPAKTGEREKTRHHETRGHDKDRNQQTPRRRPETRATRPSTRDCVCVCVYEMERRHTIKDWQRQEEIF